METIINIVGSVALLLWGIRMVRTGVTRSFGAELRRVLSLSAKNRVTGFLTGLAAAAAVQSSTATAMIVSSFAGQGLIGGVAALAIVLGADVGTTIVVQLLSFDIKWISPLFLALGVFTFLASEKARHKNLGRIALGFGLVLLALKQIVLSSAPLRETETVSLLLQPLSAEPLLAILVVALLTWFSHSSVAIVLLIATFAASQVISTQAAFVMVLGANLGGAFTAFVMTLQSPVASRRVTTGNLFMRGCGVLAALPLIPYAMPYVAMMGGDHVRAVANFHLMFNLALAVAFLPLLSLVDPLVRRLVPERPDRDDLQSPKYLDSGALESPTVALSCAARETLRMGDEVREMLQSTLQVFVTNDDTLRKEVERSDDLVDRLHEAIKLYLTSLSQQEMDAPESKRCVEILSFTTNLEHIGDIIDKNLMELAAKKIKGQTLFSTDGAREIDEFHQRIIANLDLAMSVFMSGDLNLARQLIREKSEIRHVEQRFTDNHFARIGEGRPESIASSSLHLDVLRDLKRINSHLTSVAYPILERAGELADSRLMDGKEENTDARPRPIRMQPTTK
ncbi:Na/Pi cotransporter family protein [Hwanghaeella grinnelliae]|uniref:Na/Pi cotransporter family protein n=1 Tax=Hwanghaeella grinnelliae TaxID=2500179 RepID=A0A437QU53_9PROT|nr:Na/Pi cotransporter family protein [Hwanghaeella grinnelliae]RVU38031.1 Na/Pi cotransporter family protein [Hwanghaeella grinnelliae]